MKYEYKTERYFQKNMKRQGILEESAAYARVWQLETT
jgi:hypothetical protein